MGFYHQIIQIIVDGFELVELQILWQQSWGLCHPRASADVGPPGLEI